MLLLGINILLFMFIVIVVKFKFNYLFLYNLDTAEKVSQGGRSRTRNLSCLCVMKKDTYRREVHDYINIIDSKLLN